MFLEILYGLVVLYGLVGLSGICVSFAIHNYSNILPARGTGKSKKKKKVTKQTLLVDFLRIFSQRDYGELINVKGSTIETEGSEFMVYISEWGDQNYFISFSHLEFGRVMSFSYEEQRIKNFKSDKEFVDFQNVEKVKEYLDIFLTKYVESKLEDELKQHAIKQRMEGAVKTKETVNLDTDIMQLINEIDTRMDFISIHLDLLDAENQYRYEQTRYEDIGRLIESYKQLDDSLKKENKSNLLGGLTIIQTELEGMLRTIKDRKNYAFERNLEIVKQRY